MPPMRGYGADRNTYEKSSGFGGRPLKNRYIRAMGRQGELAGQGEDLFFEQASAFDPYAAAERSARGMFDTFREDLGQDIGDLRGQQVGMGRLDTGFATEDEDRLITGGIRNLNNEIAGRSMQAAGMDWQRIQGIGGAAMHYGDNYLDLVSGGLDRYTAEENAKRSRKKGIFGAIGTGLGAIGGFALGGPAGAAAGARIGGSMGGGFGG
jgi:hypothetical protein